MNENNYLGLDIIKTTDIRRARFYFKYMHYFKRCDPINLSLMKDINGLIDFLNFHLNKNFREREHRVNFIKDMEHSYSNNILEKADFDWIKGSKRACYWLWLMLKNIEIDKLKRQGFPFPKIENGQIYVNKSVGTFSSFLPQNSLNPLFSSAINHEQRFNQVVDFFDSSNAYHVTYGYASEKRDFLAEKKSQWTSIQRKNPLRWLNSADKDQCQWAFQYLQRVVESRRLSTWEYSVLWIEAPMPDNTEEVYLGVSATIDAWNVPEEFRKCLLQDMRKAWSQKKFRAKNEDNAPLNTFIKKTVKEKLTLIAQQDNKHIKDVLEHLISAEFGKRRNEY